MLENNSFTIYGQTVGTGTLTINGVENDYAGIGGQSLTEGKQDSGTIIINGGTIQVTGGQGACAIGSSSSGNGGIITINGGNITAQAGDRGIGIGTMKHGSDYGRSTITINGGTVSTAEIDGGKAELTLSWTEGSDFIANSKIYYATTARIKDGQMLTDDAGNYYSGTLTNEQKASLTGKTLSPVPDAHAITIGTVTGCGSTRYLVTEFLRVLYPVRTVPVVAG